MSNLAENIRQELTEAVASDKLELPTLPEVALRIRDVAEREDVNAQKLGAVIAEDPGLAARMVRMANSPMFRAVNPIEDLNMALSRLGVEYAANLATGLAMKQMFQAPTDLVDRKLRNIWARSSEVAATSGVLAKAFTPLRVDQATLAGLTHGIGALPILYWAEDNPSLLKDSLTLDRVIDAIHGSLGSLILKHWEFPAELVDVPVQYHDFDRVSEQVDYADVVTVAYLQSLPEDHPDMERNWATIEAFARLGLEGDSSAIELEDLSEDLESARAALS